MELPQEVRDLFAEEMAAKFLATVDPEGKPNVALIVTLQPPPDGRKDRLIFGEFLMWKTREYLEGNPRVAAAVVNTKLRMATLTGDFVGFEKTGPYKQALDASNLMRYNAYSGMRAAGVIDVREASPARRASMAAVPLDFLKARMHRAGDGSGAVAVPAMVKEKFVKLTSVKALAVMGDDAYPRIHPVMAAAPAGDSAFVLQITAYNRELAQVRVPCPAALCVLTFDIKSYKVKGELAPLGPHAVLFKVNEVYNAMPPLAGDLISSCRSS
ncbi:MAG: pyridoxamine 5'-phosphate oxidase family protein [Actinomycetota bacterium]|nr:pyridoxamine 5'-phosphate oxidase family protein [Actinomycetota bacterium]MDD5666534.1 pyridoxamine 5'-phosphate oxidase family protein [Actinomycetota bacterium]